MRPATFAKLVVKGEIVALNKGNFMSTYEILTGDTIAERQHREWLNELAEVCHLANLKWWQDPITGQALPVNRPEKLMLMVSEIAEAMEGERKNRMDDHLPHRKMAEVELADAMIRILDYAYAFQYDIGGAFVEKMRYNATRKDHSHEERLKEGGKKF